jgi:AbrB family looped-hinge helix DNA binding protein
MKSFPIRLQKDGAIVVPHDIREQFNLQEGDLLNLMEIEGIILLTLQQSKVPQLADQIATLREESKMSLYELLQDLNEQRKEISQKR